MGESDEREGHFIYKLGKVEVRDYPNGRDMHNVWIGENYFLLRTGWLEQFAEGTPIERFEIELKKYDRGITVALRREKIPVEQFALILARTRIRQLTATLNDTYGQIRSLEDHVVEK